VEHWSLLRLGRLEEHHRVQRCGLTPTDLLHARGRFDRWDAVAARRLCELVSAAAGVDAGEFIESALAQMVGRLAVELLKKQLDDQTDPDAMDDCPACRTLLENLLAGGDKDLTVRIRLHSPVIGVGAPVHYFLPRAAGLLDTEAIIPPNADVANAVGAITSNVVVCRHAEIGPDESGHYAVHGLAGARSFERLDEAHAWAVGELVRSVRSAALAAGTGATDVAIAQDDRIAAAADGTEIFLARVLTARLAGRPDVARQVRSEAAQAQD